MKIFYLILSCFIIPQTWSQASDASNKVEVKSETPAIEKPNAAETLAQPIAGQTQNFKDRVRQIRNDRDPFQRPRSSKVGDKFKRNRNKVSTDLSSKLDEILPTLDIQRIIVVGILMGKERRAMIRVGDPNSPTGPKGKVFTLKEGMELGTDPEKAKLTAILPGGVVFVEKLTNIFGEEDFIETVIPVLGTSNIIKTN